jgi:TetR/AcrR family transcriptional repressor of nem operon
MPRPSVREQIVTAGAVLLLERGFNASGVQDITAAAGVPKGSFYNHFPSKEAFGAEVVERYWADNAARLAVLRDASIPPLERLRQYFTAQVDTIVSWDYQQGCLFGNFAAEMSDHSPAIRARLAEIFTAWIADIARAVRDAQTTGDLPAGSDPEALAAFLLSAWEGAVLRSRAGKGRDPLDNFLHTAFTKLLT